jgi:hypothetical protein
MRVSSGGRGGTSGSKFLADVSVYKDRDALDQQHHMSDVSTTTDHPSGAELVGAPVPSMIDALDTDWWRQMMDFLFTSGNSGMTPQKKMDQDHSSNQNNHKNHPTPWWKVLFLIPHHPKKEQVVPVVPATGIWRWKAYATTTLQNWLDPCIVHPKPSTLTDLIDKVLTSTPRLLAIANLLLALTYQMHTAVADWFLGIGGGGALHNNPAGEWAMTGRERLGSFLVFKLLLISAVVAPDTLDLLILLSWYTLLSFLRSLAHLAAATTSHTTQSGQAPRSGVLQLLLLVLLSDFVALAVCVALFQPAGAGMVVLLACDCALLAVEVLGHILKHVRQVLEDMHEHSISDMEEQQLQIHTRQRQLEERQQQQQEQQPSSPLVEAASEGITEEERAPARETGGDVWDVLDYLALDNHGDNADVDEEDEDDNINTHHNNRHLLLEDSRRLDQAMDVLEVAHARRVSILDTTIFILQLVVHALTVAHFLHIWTLHGIQFTLIDGVLALHLHSALSAASKQIAERRNLHRIARNLDGMFPNASELDLKMAMAAGDVCCICLGAMSAGSVKKVGCGHLYHTNCLREVVERAHSMEAARCPLCRASVVDGSHAGSSTANGANGNNANGNEQGGAAGGGEDNADGNNGNGDNPNGGVGPRAIGLRDGAAIGNHRGGAAGAGERALFRFSTEGILPTWMPLPAFSFEVVRRPTRQDQQPAAPRMPRNNNTTAANNNNNNNNNRNAQPPNQHQQSFLRRLLLFAGAVPMSPEEEARALTNLVDMFPQYDRADLLRELRDRGSAESVVESVLLGVFSGRPRGSAGGDVPAAEAAGANNQGQEEAAAEEEQQEGEAPAVSLAAADEAGPQQVTARI